MAKISLAYVHAYTDVRGKRRHYYRRQGRRFALKGAPGSAEFMECYAAAEALFADRSKQIVGNAPKAGTVEAVSQSYYRSAAFQSLRPSTKATYRGIIDGIRREHGLKRVAHLERRHIADIVSKKLADGGPSAANNLLRMLGMLCAHAVELGFINHNPTVGVRKVRTPSDGFATWSEADIAAYEKRWARGTRERLALAILLYTGQRRGDVVRMGRQHVQKNVLTVTQSKTGETVSIPLHPELRRVIASTPKDQLTFLTTKHGAPYTPAGFGNAFRDWCDEAGLSKLSAHGLRKAAARRLAEAGCSAHQIASITGHRTLKEVQRYAARADRMKLAKDAMKSLTKNVKRTSSG